MVELEILYRDEYFIAVNKPSGMLVHRTWLDRHETQFVMQTLRDQIDQHVYPVHRLDRPTSGVLMFALSSEVAREVMPLFAQHAIQKTYHAVVRGWIDEGGILDYPLKEELDKIADKRATDNTEAKEAITHYQPLAQVEVPYSTGRFPTTRYGLVELKPQTGRKHQLRRHMAHLRHPIVGDTRHGEGRHNRLYRDKYNVHRLMLHATHFVFDHPYHKHRVSISAGFDSTWTELCDALGWSLPQ